MRECVYDFFINNEKIATGTAKEIVAATGIPYSKLKNYKIATKKGDILFLKEVKTGKREFALYYGEEILAMGSMKEIAKATGLKYETIRHYTSPVHLRRIKARKVKDRPAKIMIEITEDEY